MIGSKLSRCERTAGVQWETNWSVYTATEIKPLQDDFSLLFELLGTEAEFSCDFREWATRLEATEWPPLFCATFSPSYKAVILEREPGYKNKNRERNRISLPLLRLGVTLVRVPDGQA